MTAPSDYSEGVYTHEFTKEHFPTMEDAVISMIKLRKWPEEVGEHAVYSIGTIISEELVEPEEAAGLIFARIGSDSADFESVNGMDGKAVSDKFREKALMPDWADGVMASTEWNELGNGIATLIDNWAKKHGMFTRLISAFEGGDGVLISDEDALEIAQEGLAAGKLDDNDLGWVEAEFERRASGL